MVEIKFKVTRCKHESGWRLIDKSGDLQYDLDANAKDGIWIMVTKPGRIFIDCEKTGMFRIVFGSEQVEKNNDR